MLWVYALFGALIGGVSGLAHGSMRRLIVGASAAVLLVFAAFPFSEAVGFLSRDAVKPTPLGLVPVFPAFLLLPVLAGLVLLLAPRGGRVAGWGAVGSGLALLAVGGAWHAQGPLLAELRPIYGLMEAVVGGAVLGVGVLLGLLVPAYRKAFLAGGLVLGGAVFFWFASPQGHTYFPQTAGYYKLLRPVPPETEAVLIETYNAELDQVNAIRAELGLPLLEPITSLTAIAEGRIPKEVAEQGFRLVQPGTARYGSVLFFLMAGLMLSAGAMLVWNPRLQEPEDLQGGLILAGAVGALTPAFSATEFSFKKLVEGWPFLVNFLDLAWPPLLARVDSEPKIYPLQEVASQMAITLEIALVGTFLAAVVALPTSFLAARNLTQGNPFMRVIFFLMRAFYNIDRGVDTLILALVFVAAVGLGPAAGVLAMAIHSIADLGKLYSEAIENVDRGPIEALESVGASGASVVRWAILPQVMPLFVAYTLYRFEINFRVSIVLGLVGAGGIGFFIQEKMASGQYNQLIIAIIAIVIVVNVIDFASSWLRSRLV
ncbi:phosphonate ABC transporter, permease protein PhnE [Marinithermus hydrothermalis]|uniref:Phosphonate ABC transporter, inner membrane subunit n=1 Tax=Marinithermus hydrothermalis (strain DSM 14884 / JCM 11576 / T1) TaxID=869210 RepID=F2NKR2_MARHT|nr:phosphonate ABC transporter, permease protein PhnE [Marinithermus hydrothermalis]AEB10825.1 phosphonate ABC transporter, inner membrane subunit [Marinithermus hydrothermalis DSM 14884]